MSEATQALMFALVDAPHGGDTGEPVLFLNARPAQGLDAWRRSLVLCHWSKQVCHDLEEQGWKITQPEAAPPSCREVWLLPDRQRDCQFGELAEAWERVLPGGWLRVSLANDWGAKRLEEQWREVAGVPVEVVSKHHCRVFSSQKTDAGWNVERLQAWRKGSALQRLPESGWWSRPGLFSWDRADPGSMLLAAHLPESLRGVGADLGVGWGFLSMEVLRRCPDLDALDGFENDARALEPARRNLGNVLVPVRPRLYWRDVTRGVGHAKYDFVVMNPPFHEGRSADPGLGIKFIHAAARALKPEGVLWMVANQQLPYEACLGELFEAVTCPIQRLGFKVLSATGVKSRVHHRAGPPLRQRRK